MKHEKIAQGLKGLLGVGAVAIGLGEMADAGTMGYLEIENNLNSNTKNVMIMRNDDFFTGARDSHDSNDGEANSNPTGYPNLYSDITTHKLWDDVRAEDSTAAYNIMLSFNGGLGSDSPNWLEFNFPYDSYGDYEFNDMQISLQKKESGVLTGSIYDIRDIIDNHSGRLDLDPVSVGTYDQWKPYAEYEVKIEPMVIVPEPSTLAGLAVGLLGAGAGMRRRRRNRRQERQAGNRNEMAKG